MHPNTEFKNIIDSKVGDVILCHCDPSKDLVAKKIAQATNSEYCHAAIYYGNSLVAESTAKEGIKKGKIAKERINKLISRYDHIAVLRQPDAWVDTDRIQSLQLFIDKVINAEAKYNLKGVFSFKNRKELHEAKIYEKLSAFFDDELSPDSEHKSEYFCSEFVCDCFIAVGFISQAQLSCFSQIYILGVATCHYTLIFMHSSAIAGSTARVNGWRLKKSHCFRKNLS